LSLILWANAIVLLVMGIWFSAQVRSVARLHRLRNALYARRGTIADFDWTPNNVPAGFIQEIGLPYAQFRDAVTRMKLDDRSSDWYRALRIAEHLVMPARDLASPIRSDLETTYTKIQSGRGYCADFVKVFLGLAHAAGIFARQWSFTHNGFAGFGHTVVEIFDRASGKWLFLDIFNNFHVCNALTSTPMGVLEFREALMHSSPAIRIVPNGTSLLGYPIEERLLAYFRRGLNEWYLVCGNAVFFYESNPLVRWSSRISGQTGQVVAACFGRHPSIQILTTPENTQAVDELIALARKFRVAIILCLAVIATLSFN
jgi:hypothetical protein